MGPISCTETSVRNYHCSLLHGPEERGSHILRDGSLKSRIPQGRSSFLTPHPTPRSAYRQTFLCSPQETETGVLFLRASRIFLHPSAMIHTGEWGGGWITALVSVRNPTRRREHEILTKGLENRQLKEPMKEHTFLSTNGDPEVTVSDYRFNPSSLD